LDRPPSRTVGSAQRFDLSARVATVAALAIAAAKLWLSHSEEICGSATYHDAFWFVRAARDWYWGADYNWTAFVRPPAYPLWLALVDLSGVRQRLAIDLLQLGGYATLMWGLARAGVPRVVCVICFAAAAFHPGSFWQNNYTMADPFYAAVLPIAVGGMLLMMASRSKLASLGTGFALAVLWLTREESVLVAIVIAAHLAIWTVRERSADNSTRRIVFPAALMVAAFGALVLLAYGVNNRTFSAFAKSEMSAPSYERALHALLRIKSPTQQRYVPVTSDSLARAFEVSPTFARLKAEFDAGAGAAWRTETLNQQGVSGEIGINYLMWALRHAAGNNGIHADARTAEKFYNRMAREINAACDAGRVETRIVWASFIGPNLLANAHELLPSFGRILGVFVQRYEVAPLADDEILSPEERALYDEITNRRPLSSLPRDAAPFSTALKNVIGTLHRYFISTLALLGALSVGILLLRGRLRFGDSATAALLLMFVAIVSRVGLFTVIDATSWPIAYERFLFPVMPMTSVFLVVLIFQAAQELRSRATR
jgi:hypothetical protein